VSSSFRPLCPTQTLQPRSHRLQPPLQMYHVPSSSLFGGTNRVLLYSPFQPRSTFRTPVGSSPLHITRHRKNPHNRPRSATSGGIFWDGGVDHTSSSFSKFGSAGDGNVNEDDEDVIGAGGVYCGNDLLVRPENVPGGTIYPTLVKPL